MMDILPIKAFTDNYIWLMKNGRDAIVVDPGNAQVVDAFLSQHQLNLHAILITHHHADHIGGVNALQQQYDVTVYAPSYGQYTFSHQSVKANDRIHIEAMALDFDVIWLPGHTKDHIAYQHQQHLFCGDVLFGAGCGRIFDGTLAQQFASLNRIKQLPLDTRIYCAHEYTLHNLAFACSLEPDNEVLANRQACAAAIREQNQATVPLSLQEELDTNPFLRCDDNGFKQQHPDFPQEDFAFFCKIRELRNHY